MTAQILVLSTSAAKRIVRSLVTALVIFFIAVMGSVPWLFMRAIGRIRIVGKENIQSLPKKSVLFVSNHPSYLDPMTIAFALSWPEVFFQQYRVPWQAPDMHNLGMHIPLLGYLMASRCIAVNRRGDPGRALPPLLQALAKGWLLYYPEGTRSGKAEEADNLLTRTANGAPIGKPKLGVGWLIEKSNPAVVPIFVRGTGRVLPVGSWLPMFNRAVITVTIGKPIQIKEESRATERERQQDYANNVMKLVASLDASKAASFCSKV